MGAFTRTDKAEIARVARHGARRAFPRLKERYSQAAGTMSGGEQQMLVIGRALMAKPRLLLLDEPSLGVAPKLVQDIARSIVAINRDEKVSVLLVEQNSRMALRISQRAYALTTGTVALSGNSAELLERRPGQGTLSRRRDLRRIRQCDILVINPNTTASMTEKIGEAARGAASPGTEDHRRQSAPTGRRASKAISTKSSPFPGMIAEMQKHPTATPASSPASTTPGSTRRAASATCRSSASARRPFTWRAWLPASSAS